MSPNSDSPTIKTHRATELEREIARITRYLEALREELKAEQAVSQQETILYELPPSRLTPGSVNKLSPPAEKIALFRSLFAGRPDAYAVRWTSARTAKSGWSPAVRGGYYSDSKSDSDLLPLDDAVIERHLTGAGSYSRSGPDLHVGIYPMLQDDTCRLLACDFDGGSWRADAGAYAEACRAVGVPCATEISRSGAGAHVWIFFSRFIEGRKARALGAALLRSAMTTEAGMSLRSYDRFFPAQDALPTRAPGRHRLGNLIALPLQGTCRRKGTTVFVDPETWVPYEDQFGFLASLERVTAPKLEAALTKLEQQVAGAEPVPRALPILRASAGASEAHPEVCLSLGAQISIDKANLPPRVVTVLKHLSSVQNPEFYRKQAQRFSTFGTPRFVVCFEEDDTTLRLPRGLLGVARTAIDAAGLKSTVSDRLPVHPSTDHEFQGTLRADQQAALEQLLAHDIGVLVAPPGSGKTVIACAMIAEGRLPTAIVVNRAELAAQWRERLSQFLGVKLGRIGQLGAGRRKLHGQLDIIMLQSISHRTADPELLSRYGFLIVDECHGVAAPASQAALRQVATRFWLGLTATPFRADQMNELITMQLGPIRHEMAEVQPTGRKLMVRETGFRTDEPGTDGASFQAIYGELAMDSDRNSLILNDVVSAFRAGRRSLVLSNRVRHVRHLAEALRARVGTVNVLHGALTRSERAATLAALRKDHEQPVVLVAIDKVAGEGLDLPEFDSLFLTMPVSFKGKVIQQVGRISRGGVDGSSDAYVYDYNDVLVPVLERMHRRRLRVMERRGFVRLEP